MFAIYKRELKSYFTTVIGFLFIASTLFLVGIYFTLYNLMYGYPYVSYALQGVVFIFFITVPILTMKVLSEERRQKIDQLIFTAPISVGKVVVGKYLALLSILGIPTAVICVYPLILSKFGSIPYGENYTGILGFFLYGAASIAIALFISSFTESQVICAVLSFAALFVGYMMNGISNLISNTGNTLTKILSAYDLSTPFNNFVTGTLDLKAVVYYLSLVVLMLFLTCQSIQKRRFSISTKNITMSAFSSSLIVIVIAITVLVNLVVGQLPATVTSIDMTQDKLYSLTSTTEDIVSSLNQDVTIYVVGTESSVDATFKETLKKYDDLSDHIKVVYKDPVVSPNFYKEYTDTISEGSAIVVSDSRNKVIDSNDLYTYEMDQSTLQNTITGYDGEGLVTSAITYVTSDNMPKAYIIEGHNELALDTTFSDEIDKENITTESINLLKYDAVPDDADFIIINAPTTDFSTDDTAKIIDYLDKGGNLFIVSSYSETDLPNFESIMAHYGVTKVDGMVVEGDKTYYNQVPYYLLPDVASDTVTDGIYGKYYIFAPFSQGLILPTSATDGITITSLLTTSDSAYAKQDVSNTDDYSKQLGDIDGPFTIGIKIDKTIDDTDSYIYYFTSESMFTANANTVVSGANGVLFNNCISTFINQDITNVVPVKSYSIQYITTTEADTIFLGICTAVVIPVFTLVAGLVIWLKRRKR